MDQDLISSEADSIMEIESDNVAWGGRAGTSEKQPRNPGNAMCVGRDMDVEIQDIQAVKGMGLVLKLKALVLLNCQLC